MGTDTQLHTYREDVDITSYSKLSNIQPGSVRLGFLYLIAIIEFILSHQERWSRVSDSLIFHISYSNKIYPKIYIFFFLPIKTEYDVSMIS